MARTFVSATAWSNVVRVDAATGTIDNSSPPAWANTVGPSQSWARGIQITEVVVPKAEGSPEPTYSAIALPAGITFDPDTRTISGTPTGSGGFTIRIRATNTEGATEGAEDWTMSVSIVSTASKPSWRFNTGDLQRWTTGQDITDIVVPAAAGAPHPTYSATGLPTGITFDPDTRTISGRPTAAGTGTITITATNSSGSADWTMDYVISAPVALTAPGFPSSAGAEQDWIQNAAITALTVPAATGNPAPTYSAEGLPAGVVFNRTSRKITGRPTGTGKGTIIITATNSQGSDTYSIPWTVTAPRAIEAPAFPAGRKPSTRRWVLAAQIIQYTVPTATGFPAPTYSAAGLPGGVIFDSRTRTIHGTPSETVSGTITITATNPGGSATFKIDFEVADQTFVYSGVGGTIRNQRAGRTLEIAARLASGSFLSDWTGPDTGLITVHLPRIADSPVLSTVGNFLYIPSDDINLSVLYTLSAPGEAPDVDIAGLPGWMSYDHSPPTEGKTQGRINFSGSYTSTGTENPQYTIRVSVTDERGNGSSIRLELGKTSRLSINGIADRVIAANVPLEIAHLVATGGTLPITYTLVDPVPAGVSISGDRITAKISATGDHVVTVRAVDALGQETTDSFTVSAVEVQNFGVSESNPTVIFRNPATTFYVGGLDTRGMFEVSVSFSRARGPVVPELPPTAKSAEGNSNRTNPKVYFLTPTGLLDSGIWRQGTTSISPTAVMLSDDNFNALQNGVAFYNNSFFGIFVEEENTGQRSRTEQVCEDIEYCWEWVDRNGENQKFCWTVEECHEALITTYAKQKRSLKVRSFRLDGTLNFERELETGTHDTAAGTDTRHEYEVFAVTASDGTGSVYIYMRRDDITGLYKLNAGRTAAVLVQDRTSLDEEIVDMAANADVVYMLDAKSRAILSYDDR